MIKEKNFTIIETSLLKLRFMLFVAILATSLLAFPQSSTVTGKITDKTDGLALIGATVLIKGTTNGTITDVDGNYTLGNVNSTDTLLIRYLGFAEIQEVIGDRTTIDLAMQADVNSLDEVVVIGYGTTTKAEITESVSSIKSDEIVRSIGTSFEGALQGRMSGVKVTTSDGTPGAGISINVRGVSSINSNSEPLYVIDGVPITKDDIAGVTDNDDAVLLSLPFDPLAGINPNDIESIEVLKDASATAIYGSRGSNGVVLITTKKGKAGKIKVTYDPSIAVSSLRRKLDLLDAPGYYEYMSVLDPNAPLFTNPNAVGYIGDAPFDSLGTGVDWQDELYRDAIMHNHQVSFSGGNESFNFFTSLGYLNQEGIIIASDFERYSALTNINVKADRLKVDINLNFSHTEREGSVYASGGPGNNDSGVITKIGGARPLADREVITSVEFEEEDENADPFNFFSNPYLLATEATNDDSQTRVTGNVRVNYELLPSLSIEGRIGGNVVTSTEDQYFPQSTGPGFVNEGIARINRNENTRVLAESLIRYKFSKKRHNLRALMGVTYERLVRNQLRVRVAGFPDDETAVNNLERGTTFFPTRTQPYTERKLASLIGRINYNYKRTYFLTISGRRDGSTAFSNGEPWGFFPSAAVAWTVSNERFLKQSNVIDFLKLRYSIGATGNQSIPPYQSLALLDDVTYNFGGQLVSGLAFGQFANTGITWETNIQNNVGFDIDLFESKVSLSVDGFVTNTKDALLSVPLSAATAQPGRFQNAGEIQNRGIEISLTTQNISTEELNWTTNFNFSRYENEIISLGEISEFFVSQGSSGGTNLMLYREGGEVGQFYGFVTDGIFLSQEDIDNSPVQALTDIGGFKYKDISGPNGLPDGVIDDFDRTVLGSSLPDFFGGITNTLSYKNFDLSVFFEYSVGQDLFNGNNTLLLNQRTNRNKLAIALDEATVIGNDGNVETVGRLPAIGTQEIRDPFDMYVEDASYLRLQNVTIGYTVPLPERMNISKLRTYVSGNNLWLLTNYTGYDPDVNTTRNNGLIRGVDFGSYPRPMTIIGGLNIVF